MRKRGPANAAQTPKEDAERHDRTLRAVELRRKGMSYPDIARILEVSVSTAWEDVWRHFSALDKLATEQLEQVRSLELARLDRWLERINARIEMEDISHDALAKLVMTGAKLQERRAKLQGLDAPTKVEHSEAPDKEDAAKLVKSVVDSDELRPMLQEALEARQKGMH